MIRDLRDLLLICDLKDLLLIRDLRNLLLIRTDPASIVISTRRPPATGCLGAQDGLHNKIRCRAFH